MYSKSAVGEHHREYTPAEQQGGETPLMKDSKAVREKVLESFRVKEWGLFEG